MTPQVGFVVFLVATVALLGAVVFTGVKARIRAHIPLVVLTAAALGVTIYFAEKLGELYDLASAGAITPVHLTLAKIATASYVLPIVTGALTLRNRSRRRVHLACALLTLALTVATAITGAWMLFASTPKS